MRDDGVQSREEKLKIVHEKVATEWYMKEGFKRRSCRNKVVSYANTLRGNAKSII